MTYRKEIDGLRAISVISVIFVHAGFGVPRGGFVGVDIFFVISGYLISKLIIADIETGKFSLVKFYERRARRLWPALFIVMLFCGPFAWASMMPSQFNDFLKSAAAATLFCSNLLFWRTDDYFDFASWLKPLLHTWSLGVEEQFYIFFPLVLMFLWRCGRKFTFVCIFIAALCSLAISEWGWRHAPVANYYLAVSRAWELLAGSMCAFLTYSPSQRSKNILGTFGFASVLFSLFYFDEATPFPSVYALLPVLGTMLILLFVDATTGIGRLLNASALTSVGLISYSLYLWHQPIFAFARIYSVGPPSRALMTCLTLLSFALAWLSWRFVEQPFRHPRRHAMPNRRTILIAGLAFASTATLVVSITKALPIGSNSKLLAMLDYPMHRSPFEECTDPGLNRDAVDLCKLVKGVKADAALIGDSHAEDKLQGLYMEDRQRNWIVVASSGCSPFYDVYVGIAQRNCDTKAKAALDYVVASPSVTTVAISFLSSYVSAALYAADHADKLRQPFEAKRVNYPKASREEVFETGLTDIIELLHTHNKKIILLIDQPELPFYPGECLKGRLHCELDERLVLKRQSTYRHIVYKVGKAFPSMQIYDPIGLFCKNGKCGYRDGDTVLYRDSNHLTLLGSSAYARRFLAWESAQNRTIGRRTTDRIALDER